MFCFHSEERPEMIAGLQLLIKHTAVVKLAD